MKRRFRFAFLFGLGLVFLVLMFRITLPTDGKDKELWEKLVFGPGNLIAEWMGLEGHDVSLAAIVYLTDILLYSLLGLGVISIWDRIRQLRRAQPQR
jgi:hypothetical protein